MKHSDIFRNALLLALTAPMFSHVVHADGGMRTVTFSQAGYWPAENSPRLVSSMNPGWSFSLDGFKTSKPVNLPHCIDEGELGIAASGCVNRQQPAWYRKTFDWQRRRERSFLHFEAVMGKCRISVNGRQVAVHFGGFLPIHVDVTDVLREGKNTVEVWCDNSDDNTFPPGRRQRALDWTYFGGIYRDVWLVETGGIYVTDSDRGGVYVTSRLLPDGGWEVSADVTLGGKTNLPADVRYVYDGKPVGRTFRPERPSLWTPDEPNLHRLEVRVSHDGVETDAVAVRFGIRDFTIDGRGLTLNGRPWRKLVGVNRHQDFAFIGMALPNSLHWRDVVKYREAGFTCIRNAHYPQDPAFMDACDALGMFVIVNPPGWQYWNRKDPVFERRVRDDVEKMVRRDRSRASLLFWEPILNETSYPESYARDVYALVKKETRRPNYCACDRQSKGSSVYDIVYCHRSDPGVPSFTREWGDFPDDWTAQNSPSRVPIEWGETPMLVQAEHYTRQDYGWCIEKFSTLPPNHFGGCLWHGADHSRGYHPDNFFGGILTYDRRKKYSWYACKAALTEKPFVFLANQLAPCSPPVITVFSNCPYKATWLGRPATNGMPLDRVRLKRLRYAASGGDRASAGLTRFVIDLPDGTSVTNHHAGRFSRIVMEADHEGLPLLGDGSDLVACAAIMSDRAGRPRRYQNETVVFSVEGNAQLVGENPQRTRWGEAVILVRPLSPGKITVKAVTERSGIHLPPAGVLTLEALPSTVPAVKGDVSPCKSSAGGTPKERKASEAVDLGEVEKQQKAFGMTQ